jgi:hypothetical protein
MEKAAMCDLGRADRGAGYDEFMVACDAGTFVWRTVRQARAEHGEEPTSMEDSARSSEQPLH